MVGREPRSRLVTKDPHRALRATLLGFGALAALFSGAFPPFTNPNEISRLQTVVAAVEHGTFAIDAVIPVLGDHEDKALSGGKTYSNKAPGLALAAIPVYALLRVAMPAPTGASDPIFWVLRFVTVSLVTLLALQRLGRRVARTDSASMPLVVCAVAFGTPYLFYARSFFGHAWTAALLFLSFDLLSGAGERGSARREAAVSLASGFLAGWAAISEYSVAPVALLLAVRLAAGRSWRRLALFGLGAAAPLLLLALYDRICFGSPWVLSSAREALPAYSQLAARGLFGFGPPSWRVALAYLVHPARGVVLFCPFLLWAIPGFLRWWRSRENRADCLLALSVTLLYFVMMTGYPNWHGGWSLGNRYLLPILFFPAVAIAYALKTPFSRGLFAVAVVFSAASHFLLTASWPFFPTNVALPAATGSFWFLQHGWFAPSLLGGSSWGPSAALVLAAAAVAWPLTLALQSAGPLSPRRPLCVLLGLAPLLTLLLRPPQLDFGGRLWRAAIFGAYSGQDPEREQLRAVAESASTESERRRSMDAERMYGRDGSAIPR